MYTKKKNINFEFEKYTLFLSLQTKQTKTAKLLLYTFN